MFLLYEIIHDYCVCIWCTFEQPLFPACQQTQENIFLFSDYFLVNSTFYNNELYEIDTMPPALQHIIDKASNFHKPISFVIRSIFSEFHFEFVFRPFTEINLVEDCR